MMLDVSYLCVIVDCLFNKLSLSGEFIDIFVLFVYIYIQEVRARIRSAREQVVRKCCGQDSTKPPGGHNNKNSYMMTASTPDILLLG